MKLEEFNKKFTGTLHICMNSFNDDTIKSIDLESQVYENNEFREPTQEELEEAVIDRPEIILVSHSIPVVKVAPNGKHFTVKDVLVAVKLAELETRGKSEWLGGVDLHHIYFEGIHPQKDGTFKVYWGS